MQTVNDIREAFLDYFAATGHQVVDSSPLVPLNDPTLMFVNAGMVQFKNVFTGVETRDYNRAVTSQKCVRAGGKHNDLENVGYTARHHTFFEMLGNFSFGDYFKDMAIELAWDLVTKDFGLAKDKLLVTVYADDDQAFDLWKKIAGLPEERILRIATSDNFWSMGDTGPCGPCSEIFFDHGEHIPGGPPGSPDEDGDRFIEIWNLVFMQFEQLTPDKRIDLPNPCVDTGMGLERIAAVMQGTHDNYETDMFKALIGASAAASGTEPNGAHNISHRVIADHLRASSFLITDGVLPSNEGRGYVLRRIMRRGMRHAHLMGCKDPLMWRLVPALIEQMGQAFPDLVRAEALITETLELEETRFKQTLDRGLGLLDEATADLSAGGVLDGETAFKLYDTFGFPLDLTQDVLRGKGMSVDTDSFNVAMDRQRQEARKAWAGSGDAATEDVWFKIRDQTGATEFLGYETEVAEGKVLAIVVDGKQVPEAKPGQEVAIVVNQTPFYGESGGQVGDAGVITASGDDAASVTITDVQKKVDALFVHIGVVEGGPLKLGDEVQLSVDKARRANIRANHSATHLLHAALRKRLGDHVTQKGSLVAPDRLRFDISHPKPVSADELGDAEAAVNEQIKLNTEVATHLMEPDAAVEAGAMALFGEKYGDEVRVVSMGSQGGNTSDGAFSTELCGGTHVKRTGDIRVLKILSEGAVAAGVRRIEALTGDGADKQEDEAKKSLSATTALVGVKAEELLQKVEEFLGQRRNLERKLIDSRRLLATGAGGGATPGPEKETVLNPSKVSGGDVLAEVAALLKVRPVEVPARVEALLAECRKLESEIEAVRQQIDSGDGDGGSSAGGAQQKDIAGITYSPRLLEGVPAKELKSLADDLKSQIGSGVVALVSVAEGKASVVVGVTDDLVERINAVDLVRVGSQAVGGKGGGGRPNMAQAGGPDGAKGQSALDEIENAIRDAR
ncbi:MAG: alanine--tRNA ligase [Proteobacteria bacterium]|nr:alanine--tRNA ligase [Pseudomonadota bacterium]MDA1023335.1 alanine--tRNA ligase [Pseudomonadota bacterium]